MPGKIENDIIKSITRYLINYRFAVDSAEIRLGEKKSGEMLKDCKCKESAHACSYYHKQN